MVSKMKKISLGILVIAVLAIGLVGATVYYFLGFRQHAEVEPVATISVYTDEGLTEELEQGEMLDWGSVSSGANTKDLWVKNTGSVQANITLNYDQEQLNNWGWTETWDYDEVALAVDEVVQVTITLTLPADVGSGHYEWDSQIVAWEYVP